MQSIHISFIYCLAKKQFEFSKLELPQYQFLDSEIYEYLQIYKVLLMAKKPSIIPDFVYSSITELVRVDTAVLIEQIHFPGTVCVLHFLS